MRESVLPPEGVRESIQAGGWGGGGRFRSRSHQSLGVNRAGIHKLTESRCK